MLNNSICFESSSDYDPTSRVDVPVYIFLWRSGERGSKIKPPNFVVVVNGRNGSSYN